MLSLRELKIERISKEAQKAMEGMPEKIKKDFEYLMKLANK